MEPRSALRVLYGVGQSFAVSSLVVEGREEVNRVSWILTKGPLFSPPVISIPMRGELEDGFLLCRYTWQCSGYSQWSLSPEPGTPRANTLRVSRPPPNLMSPPLS